MPCNHVVYEAYIRKYHINSWVDYGDSSQEDLSQQGVEVQLAYETLAVEERIETIVYDVGSLLSAIGGNLGLFLGFSCFTMLLGILKVVKLLRRKFCTVRT